jgi:retron-type reverse transcriptase
LYRLRSACTNGISKLSEEAGGGLVHGIYDEVISIENLFAAWKEFRRGKRKKPDVARFEFNLEDNLFKLHGELATGCYRPEPYEAFFVKDPKLRHIHKASAQDRLLHQALFRVLYPIFDRHFIFDSYSSRNAKGTHAGAERIESFVRKATGNWTRQAWALKCDVRKFFDSIDHAILLSLVRKKADDSSVIKLIETIVFGFEKSPGKGLPLGNVTSQLFANVYMNEFDQFAKHVLKARYYARYCDDFVIVDESREMLLSYIPRISRFLSESLKLELHPKKAEIRKARQGIDFLGQVILPHRNILRTRTKRRILRKISELRPNARSPIVASYKGLLRHGKNSRIEKVIDEMTSA